ncbi:MAG: tetratricopeptide repeat protein [Gammaproteobacteria bacterium]|nr:tetratricopeptide repeat protein [Gammaproteobacteria bacterium]
MIRRPTSNLIFSGIIIAALGLSGCLVKRDPTLSELSKVDVKIDKQAVVAASPDVARKNYQAFIDKAGANHPLYDSALNRLAELEMEAGDRKLYRDRQRQYAQANELVAKEQENEQTNYRNAIRLYENLLRTKPRDERNDKVLYQLARAYELSGELKKAILAMKRLIKFYPKSQYYLESHFRIAESHFVLSDFSQAVDYYNKVIRHGSDNIYFERALYKYGWSLYKLGKFEYTLEPMFMIIGRMKKDPNIPGRIDVDRLSSADRELVNDAFRVIALSFSQLGGLKALNQYLNEHPKSFEYSLYESLSAFYMKQDRVREAVAAFEYFIKRNPSHIYAAGLQYQVITMLDKAQFHRAAREARERYLINYGVGSEFWKKNNAFLRASYLEQLNQELAKVLSYYHHLANKRKKRTDYQAALQWYQQAIKMFPQDKQVGERYFLVGELFYEMGEYRRAVMAYRKSAFDSAAHDKQQEATYASLKTYEKLMSSKQTSKRQATDTKEYLLIAEVFATNFASDKRAAQVRVRLAELYYKNQDWLKAKQWAGQIANKQASYSAAQRYSAFLILAHISFDEQKYEQAIQAYNLALRQKVAEQQQQKSIRLKLAAAHFELAERNKAAGNHESALTQYRAVINTTQSRSIKSKAEYDIATVYVQQGNWLAAVKQFAAFRQAYPTNPLAQNLEQKLVTLYEKTGDKAALISEYERWATKEKDPDQQQQLYMKVVELYLADLNKAAATQALLKILKLPKVKQSTRVEIKSQLAQLTLEMGQRKSSLQWKKSLLKSYARLGKSSTPQIDRLAAQASYDLAMVEVNRYSQVELKLPLKKALKLKKSRMKNSLDALAEVSKFGVAEFATAATYTAAQIYSELGRALLQSQRPKGLKANELEEYELLLEEQAYPFEEKAISLHESNIYRVKQDIYDQWVQRSYQALAKLNPGRYAKKEVAEAAYETVF